MPVPLLVSTDWLAEHSKDSNLRIVDVRWYLFEKDKEGRQEYLHGHIPGAVFMDVGTELASPRGQGPGRHPLPTPERFADAAGRAGIGAETYVIAYDERSGETAARLWWLLRYFGHLQVSLLDGGITQWIAEGRPLEQEVPVVRSATFVPRPNPEMVVDQETVNSLRTDPHALILDSRVPERYEGKVEPIDPQAGHIPGAKNAPFGESLRSAQDARLRRPEELRQRFKELGADRAEKIVCYCGSGINACMNLLALELAGFAEPVLYEGSWSDWSSNPDQPIATGPNP